MADLHPQLKPLSLSYKFKLLTHNRRQPTARIVTLDGPSPVYLFISKLGAVGIFNTKLRCQKTYMTAVQDNVRIGSGTQQQTCLSFVSDCIFMPNCMKLVIATTKRTLHFYDISASIHMEEFRVTGLPSAPSCLAYWGDPKEEEPSLLLTGLDNGSFIVFSFSQPDTLLFQKVDLTHTEIISFQNVELHEEYVHVRIIPSVHAGQIHCMRYIEQQESTLSCSDDPECSVCIYDISGKRKNYVFKLLKGVRCFDLCHERAALVTGGQDGVVRLWNHYVPSQPTGILKGHAKSIVDVKLYMEKNYVFSFSQDAVFKVWSWDDWSCLQSVFLNFPTFSVVGHDPEFGKFPLHLSSDRQSIIATCGEWLTHIHLQKAQVQQDRHHVVVKVTVNDENDKPAQTTSNGEDYDFLGVHTDTSDLSPDLMPEVTPPLSGPVWEKRGYSPAKVRETRHILASLLSPEPQNDELKETKHDETTLIREVKGTPTEAREKMTQHLFDKLRIKSGDSSITRDNMRQTVWDGGPHWTLQILPLKEITFPHDLPMSTRMRAKKLVCHTGSDLLAMNLATATLELPPGMSLGGRMSRRSSLTSTSSYRSHARSIASLKSSVGFFTGPKAAKSAATPTQTLPAVFEFPLPEIRLPK